MGGDLTVVFEALRGAGYKSEVAIDDIRVYFGGCPPTAFCEFEEGTCGFESDITADFSWLHRQASTLSGFNHYSG